MQAKLYLDTVRYPLAQAECLKALKIAKSQSDLAMQASSLHFIAIAHYRMSNYDQALAYLEQEHKLRNALGDDRNLAETFHYLAVVSWRRGDYEDTTKYYREALKMLNHINYRQDRARILTAMGTMYWSQGDFQQAIKTYEEVQRLAVDIGDRRAEAEALSNLASTWFTLGEYERALKLRQQASDIHYTIGEKRMYSWDLNFMGSLYWSLGQDDLAHQYFEKTQKIATDIGWPEGQAFTLNNIGLLHWRAKEFDKALKLSQKALEIHQNIGTKHELEIVLRNLGEIYCDAGKYSKSLEYLDKALLISQTLGSKIEEMQILSDQSATYLKMGKMKKAVTCSRQSLKLLKQTRRSPHAPKLLFSHFQALHAAAQKDEALKSLYRAYRALMRRAKRINNPEFRQSFLENVPVNREIIEFYRRYFQPLELSEAESYLLLHRIRWPKGVISPCCGSKQVHVHGQVNRTSEKRYLCMKCRKTFTDRIGTAFANKNLPLSKLLQALVVVSRATDESIATQAITKLGIHAYTAKNLYRKWSAALREDKLLQRLSSELNKKSL
ncbi:tetratricopeptide repeat protein [Candidatus Acetothermia bacterium]|nr:tetratricopeptide repeat protein [Candidatus Acetothermia bacterium]